MEYHIKTEDLGKTYKAGLKGNPIEALKNLSIEVPEGAVMGFLGRNGAGKTTTIKILLGLITQTQGSAWIMGKNTSDSSAREHVSYMPEVAALDMRDTPVTFFQIIGQILGMKHKNIKIRMDEVLAEVDLTGKEDVVFSAFSRGMKQRFELAQALFSNPKLLILDEPFSGLDPVCRVEIRDLILKYNKERGTTIFFSSHILNDVEILCDSIGILDHGTLKAVGDKSDLLGVDSIEVSGTDVNPNGIMFLEKMSEHIDKKDNRITLYLTPSQDADKIAELFKKYDAKDITVKEHCKSLEEFFEETVGRNGNS